MKCNGDCLGNSPRLGSLNGVMKSPTLESTYKSARPTTLLGAIPEWTPTRPSHVACMCILLREADLVLQCSTTWSEQCWSSMSAHQRLLPLCLQLRHALQTSMSCCEKLGGKVKVDAVMSRPRAAKTGKNKNESDISCFVQFQVSAFTLFLSLRLPDETKLPG